MSDIVEFWNASIEDINPDDDPAEALAAYIRAKVMYSKTNPVASRIFAGELIHGAPHLMEYLQTEFRAWIGQIVAVMQSWIERGKMDAVDPLHLLFLIWGATQHYADFGVQVRAAMGKETLSDKDFEYIAESLIHIVLKGCGLTYLANA
ncbi:MAG: TetR family transcriptional regulator C-terminal domain-containing protein [Exilibacterium sp.]